MPATSVEASCTPPLQVGLVLYSERDKFPSTQLPQNGSIVKGASGCLAPLPRQPRPLAPGPSRGVVAPNQLPSPGGGPAKRARVADAGTVEGKA